MDNMIIILGISFFFGMLGGFFYDRYVDKEK